MLNTKPEHKEHMEDAAHVRRLNVDSDAEKSSRPYHGGEQPYRLNARIIGALVGCSLAFAGSQLIPLSFFTLYSFIARDLGGNTNFVWLKAGSSIGQVTAAVTLGPLSDLFGRKILFLGGIFLAMLGMIVCAATPTSNGFIAGQTLAGFGLMTEELLALAITAELVPTRKRSIYGAAMISGFIPWAPGALYAQLIAQSSWRYIAAMAAIWHLLALLVAVIFYNPPRRNEHSTADKLHLLKQVDFIGMVLGLAGFIVFLVGLNWGGQTYPWKSVQVGLALGLGLLGIAAFIAWEVFGAKHPLFPRRLAQEKLPFWSIMFVIFAAGINYVPMAIFWPIQSVSVYDSNHVETGINTVPVGLCILGGAVISAWLCGRWPQYVRSIMTGFCIMQTVGVGCMAAIDPYSIDTAWAPLIFGLIGVGGVLFPNQIIVTVITPNDLLATVTSLTFVVRGVSQALALALLQNRLSAQLRAKAFDIIAAPAISAGFTSIEAVTTMVASLTAIPFKDYIPTVLPQLVDRPERYEALRVACIELYSQSFPQLYYIGLGFGIAGCLASALVGDMSRFMTDNVAVIMH